MTPGGGGAAPEARWRPPGRRARRRRVTAASGGAGEEEEGGKEGSGGGVGEGLPRPRSAAGRDAEPEHAAPGAGLCFRGRVIGYKSVHLVAAGGLGGLQEK